MEASPQYYCLRFYIKVEYQHTSLFQALMAFLGAEQTFQYNGETFALKQFLDHLEAKNLNTPASLSGDMTQQNFSGSWSMLLYANFLDLILAPFEAENCYDRILWIQSRPELLPGLMPGRIKPLLGLPVKNHKWNLAACHALASLGLCLTEVERVELNQKGTENIQVGRWVRSTEILEENALAYPVLRNTTGTLFTVDPQNQIAPDQQPNATHYISCLEKPARTAEDWLKWKQEVLAILGEELTPEHEIKLRTLLQEVAGGITWPVVSIHEENTETSESLTLSFTSPLSVKVKAGTVVQKYQALLFAAAFFKLHGINALKNRSIETFDSQNLSEFEHQNHPHHDIYLYLQSLHPELWQAPIQSLEDCSPRQKAQLGLYRMMQEMLGSTEDVALAPEAVKYQNAAYQRQAAQRLVGMLEQYQGAMLCDGVGLGKTYVATTVIVHYANRLKERFPDLRISVLAPGSVVSTWQREALPTLREHGVDTRQIRVISHAKLSSLKRSSELLTEKHDGLSDVEHLMLSELVIVDEAHNFRSLGANRTKILRDLLRLQPQKAYRRRVLLLTATPINNSLEDLRQQLSLLFCDAVLLDAQSVGEDTYQRNAVQQVQSRARECRRARKDRDVWPLLIHNDRHARFSDTIPFRDDLDFGPVVQRIGDYLKEQNKKLDQVRESIREQSEETNTESVRIANELLDRVVVQRSRQLCKQIENNPDDLLFRPDAGAPERLTYEDTYDNTKDVLSRFLPLFDRGNGLTLKVYIWHHLRDGNVEVAENSSVIGLQRVLILKRLESSPVSFLITVLRLLALHAYRLNELRDLALKATGNDEYLDLNTRIKACLAPLDTEALRQIRLLVSTTNEPADENWDFVRELGHSHQSGSSSAVDPHDNPIMLQLFVDEEDIQDDQARWQHLAILKDDLLHDFALLAQITPELIRIVFGSLDENSWPRQFIAGGTNARWPDSVNWARRLISDAKLKQLFQRLIKARAEGQKVIVFSQFTDTLHYIHSVIKAAQHLDPPELERAFGHAIETPISGTDIKVLLSQTAVITGDSDDKDSIINAFAPFYRIGPFPPPDDQTPMAVRERAEWEGRWRDAALHPIDVLFTSDVLAEGVNLQDAAVLINFDIHWNPVRMIQRAGRIDRRLNPAIETATAFEALDQALKKHLQHIQPPTYYWHGRPHEAPRTVNMILPGHLEQELLLQEKISNKVLAMDLTLGLEQGTGAEADWMENYHYQGVQSLNQVQRERSIEQLGIFLEAYQTYFKKMNIQPQWFKELDGWFRSKGSVESSPFVAMVNLCLEDFEHNTYQRLITPYVTEEQDVYWLWSLEKPDNNLLNFWIKIDGEQIPPEIRRDINWFEKASQPIRPEFLLSACKCIKNTEQDIVEVPLEYAFPRLEQGATTISAGFYNSERDRVSIELESFFIFQTET